MSPTPLPTCLRRVAVLVNAVLLAVLASPVYAQSYNSYSGFSTTQGANQWWYRDSAGTNMVWGTNYMGGAWNSTSASPNGDWCYISNDHQHPGINGSTALDSVRRWIAPKDGTVDIVGASMMSAGNGGDGAYVIIRKSGGQQLFRGFVSPSDYVTGQRWILSTRVAAGQGIDLVVNKGGAPDGPGSPTYNGDEQILDNTISYNSGLASVSYNSATGFSSTQGANQWTYLDQSLSTSNVSYDTTYAGGAWHSNTPYTNGDWCYISATQQHPGTAAAQIDSVRRWTAPSSGTVTIFGTSRMPGLNGGDGCNIFLKKNGSTIHSDTVAANDVVGTSWGLTTTVSNGDTIDTVLNRGTTYWGDEQALNQTITYEPQAILPPGSSGYGIRVSSWDFSGGEVDARKTVNSSLAQISSSVTPPRLVRADNTPVFRAFVSTSSTTKADWPKRLKIMLTAKVICEDLRTSGSTMPNYSETSNSMTTDVNNLIVSQATVGGTLEFYPSNYSCPGTQLLRRIEVEIVAEAYKANGTTIATTPTAKFTMLKRLKVMSFNIEGEQHNGSANAVTTINAIGDLIVAEKVDVVALQEVHQTLSPTNIDALAYLRTKLGPAGLTNDVYHVVECDVSATQTAGIATFSRFPFTSTAWSAFGTAVTHCMGGQSNYNAYWGRLASAFNVGAASLVIGNTHIPNPGSNYYPPGYGGWSTASYYFGLDTVSAMNSASSTYILVGDLNAIPPGNMNTSFLGYESSPSTVKFVNQFVPASSGSGFVNSVGVPSPSFVDHMFWKTTSDIQVYPADTYFRAYASGTDLSDHMPRVTTFVIR